MTQYIAGVLLVFTVAACKPEAESVDPLKTGMWRAVVEIQNQELPFNFEVTRDDQGGYDVFLLNAEERLLLDEVTITEDSVDISLHIFDANIKAIISGDSLKGMFVKNYEDDYKVPFRAVHGQDFRFIKSTTTESRADFTGTYEVTFVNEKDTTQ